MNIFINNQLTLLDEGTTLEEALGKVPPHSNGLVATVNNRIVKRDEWSHTILHDNDIVSTISSLCGEWR